jgi:phage terminase small subunit
MKNENMNVVHIGEGKQTLSLVPKPPMYLSAAAKKYYLAMGKMLAKNERLKDIYLPALEIFASAMDQFEYASKAINLKNKEAAGTGFIQVYKTGATNITTEIVLRNNASDILFKCFKQFGLDPKSESELKGLAETGQFDLFEQYLKVK